MLRGPSDPRWYIPASPRQPSSHAPANPFPVPPGRAVACTWVAPHPHPPSVVYLYRRVFKVSWRYFAKVFFSVDVVIDRRKPSPSMPNAGNTADCRCSMNRSPVFR